MKMKFDLVGMDKLIKSMKKLEKVPQKHVTAASKKGMRIALKAAKSDAPEDTSELKRGMILVGEKSKLKGKKVYRLVFSRYLNDVFQKKNKAGEISGYYPVSQEYGWEIKVKNKYGSFEKNGKFVPGKMFIHGAFNDSTAAVEYTIIDTMQKKIDSELSKEGLK